MELVARDKGGYDKLSYSDIFDQKKYLAELKESSFMEVFVEKQAFAVFVEDLFVATKNVVSDGVKNQVDIFYKSLKFLQRF